MKAVIAFAVLIVGISAGPNPILGKLSRADFQNERIVTGAIESAIEDVAQTIRDAGLDPVNIDNYQISYGLPVEVLFNIDGVIENLEFYGLSNIVVRNLNFGIITTRLTFDVELPRIALSIGKGAARVECFGEEYNFETSGSLAIISIRVNGSVRVNIGIISGISIRDVTINFALGDIDSNLNVVVANIDISDYLNNLLGARIPDNLNQFRNEINTLLEILATQVADGIL